MPPATSLPVDTPYPEGRTDVRSLRYRQSLVLLRLKNAVKMRSGEDAHFIVGADYRVSWTDGNGVETDIVVPRGMLTDLTSVPPIFRSLVGRVGPWLEAAVVHDFLAIAWRVLDGNGSARRRLFADDIMWAAMTEAKVGWVRKRLIYGAIRVAALIYYPRKEKVAPWSDFSADLGDAEIRKQLPDGVHLPD
ncbi:MAG: DUF1353 domain-containing protein [Pseudomonadota bacterium]